MSGILSVGGAGAVGVSGFYPVQINDSLRFEDGSSAYLNRTPSSAGNRRTWTWSGWVKRSNISINSFIFGCGSSSTNFAFIGFDSADKIDIRDYQGSYTYSSKTSQLFRDTSAWYHLVLAADMNNSTAADRIKLYVNGERVTSFNSAPSPTTKDLVTNSAIQHVIGAGYYNDGSGLNSYFDGYLSDINFIDGQALDATSFGETKDGVWIPKSYSGSYGTNGFHLEFNSNSNDSSGNSNNFTANNISAHDYVPDSPTNNFAVLNNLVPNAATYSEGNLKITTSSNWESSGQSIPVTSGKWYAEFIASSNSAIIGVEDFDAVNTWSVLYFGSTANGVGYWNAYGGQLYKNNSYSSYAGGSYGSTDIVGVHLDMDNKYVYFSINGVMQNSGNPASGSSGTGGEALSGTSYVMGGGNYTGNLLANFGQDSSFAGAKTAQGNTDANGKGDFYYSPSSDYLALCSENLPEPTIIDGSEYFNTVLYSGNGGTQSITGVGFSPSWVWLKGRSFLSNHRLNDVVRGASASLKSNATSAEDTTSTYYVTSFDSDGFSLNSGNGDVNQSGGTFASWNWKAGTAFSNSAGSNGATIASSGSVNTDAGFSIVSWTGNATNSTVYHALDKAPQLIIAKNRDTNGTEWPVLETLVNGATHYLRLNENYASTSTSIIWNNTNPTSNVFSIGTYSYINESLKDIIAYCFHSVDGFSKVGSYVGNYNVNGPFVYTGFRPAFIIIKSTVTTGYSWYMMDSTRTAYNGSQAWLSPDQTNTEDTSTGEEVDILSNGFKIRTNWTRLNDSGSPTYIYLAFAENPFKYANAR